MIWYDTVYIEVQDRKPRECLFFIYPVLIVVRNKCMHASSHFTVRYCFEIFRLQYYVAAASEAGKRAADET